ncbi:MAG: gliding motility-associated C-terminal domain-containing protein [Saprospiraceae bacterium]|nr:gliding motility-associated C-terminal domain-containing protein [Saprospiraceae bacterium]
MSNISFKNISKLIFLVAGFWFFTGVCEQVSATHIVGGEMTYRHITGTTYQVKLTLRRDCFLGSPEAEFDDPASIGVFTAGGELAKWLPELVNGQIFIPFMASDTLNEFIQSDCGFEGTQVCVHETTYQGFVNLPSRIGGYILAYQRCCRNASLNNIMDPLETGSTYWVAIGDKAMQLRNTSPVFKKWPDVYICADKPLEFDHSATDKEGDSLVYKLCVPNSGATIIDNTPQPPSFPPYQNVFLAPPYTLNDLMGGVPLKIDRNTGIMTAMPNLVGQFLVGVCVEEYRNGELLSVVRRDFQFNVRVCSQPPRARFTTSETECDGLTVEFYNNSLASSSYSWDFNYPSTGTTFKSTDKDPIFTFPSSGIYNVRLLAVRGTDQCFDTILQTVAVFENKIVPDFTYSLSSCDPAKDSITLSLQDKSTFDEPGYGITDWNWEITQSGQTKKYSGESPIIILSYSGEISVVLEILTSNGCKTKLNKIISIDDIIPKIDFEFELLGCPSEGLAEIKLTNLSAPLNPYATIERSIWTVDNQTYIGNPLSVNIPQDTKQFSVTLLNDFVGNCETELTKNFDLSILIPQSDVAVFPVDCPDDENVTIKIQYIDTLSNGIALSDISWNAGIITNQNGYSGTIIEVVIPKDSLLVFSMNTQYANGCIDRILQSSLPGPFATIKFAAGPIILCPDESKTIITNANPDWTYTWSPTDGLDLSDPSNPKVFSDINRTYQVTVTDGLCTVTGEVDVKALAGGITLNIVSDSVTCDGNITLNASGGIGIGTYSWGTDPSITTEIATGSTVNLSFIGKEQTYYVTFVGEACATEPAMFKVKNETPAIDDLSPFTICREDTTRILTLNLIDYHQNQYIWENDSHIISGGNSSEPQVGVGPNETAPFVLFFNVKNQFGCTLRDSVKFNIVENPITDFSFTLTECGLYQICFEHNESFNGFISWDFGDPTTNDDRSLEKKPCYIYPDGGIYTVKLSNIVNVCPFKDVVKEIVINPQINLNPIPDRTICVGDSIILNATANLVDVQYQWCDINGNTLTTNNIFKPVVSDDVKYILKGKDIYGCTDADTIAISVFRFIFSVDTKDSLCVNEPTKITLNIDPAVDYEISWSPAACIVSGSNTTSPTVLPIEGKELQLVLKHLNTGCIDTSYIKPKITQPFAFDVTVPNIICLEVPTQVNLNITNPSDYNFLWTPADCIVSGGNTASPVLKVTADKTVNVLVTKKSSGCKQNLDVAVMAGDIVTIDVDAEPDFFIYEGQDLDIFIKDRLVGAFYNWSTGETGDTITVSPSETTKYQVTVTDQNGCTATDEVTVTVRTAKCDDTDVFIPNAFTPNGDKNNDIFIARSNFIDEMELIIYNRWGQEIFKTDDINKGWDGTFNGVDLAPDTYAYYLRVLCINAEEYRKRGNVTLIR